jgi:tetratricopeptide (TPR) repeat protein
MTCRMPSGLMALGRLRKGMHTSTPTNGRVGLRRAVSTWWQQRLVLWLALLIVAAGCWVFSPAFRGGWLWDDHSELLQNRDLRGPEALWRIWVAPASADYFPLKATVQWMQWQLWRDSSTTGYHLTSVGLHLLGALLVWRLLRKLGLRLAWLGGLLFAVHPVVVESVAWMAELKNTLSLPLLLLAMCAWLDYDERGRPSDYGRALLLFVAAMLAKSSVVMLPAILLLHAWWKRGRISIRDLKASAPFFAVSLGLGLVTMWFQHQRSIGSGEIVVGGLLSRLAGAGLSVGFYSLKCILPVGLRPVYPRWEVNPPALVQFLPWLVLGGGWVWCWAKRATWGRHVLLGVGFFVINLLPVLGFITMSYQYISWVADHFVYVPLVGLVGLAAAGAEAVLDRLPSRRRGFAWAALAAVAALLAAQSHRYAGVFRDEETFWTYTVQRNPDAVVARNNLAFVLVQAGRTQEGMAQYEAALRIDPGNATTHANLGRVLLKEGRLTEGIAHEKEAIRLKPDHAGAYGDLGSGLLESGRLAEAIAVLERARQLDPQNAVTRTNLGNALLQAGRVAEAIEQHAVALQLHPDDAPSHHNLGNALARAGRLPEAVRHYEEALRLKAGDAGTHYDLAYTLALAGKTTEAIRHYEEALRLKPGFAEADNNLGSALLGMNRLAEAIAHLEQALRSRPDYAEAHVNLGNALLRAGRLGEAINHYEQALRGNPGLSGAHFNLGNALLQAGRPREAIVHYEEAVRANPDDAEARQNLELARQQAAQQTLGRGN